MRLSYYRALGALFLFIALSVGIAPSAEQPRAKRVLIISTGSRLAPGFVLVDQQLLAALRKIQSARIEIYAENLDLVRFPTERYQQVFKDYLSAKHSDNAPDLVILVYIGNLGITGKLLPQLFPNTPIIVAGFTEEELHPEQFGAAVSGVAQRVNPQATLELIGRLQPEVNRVVVIGGTTEVDRQVTQRIRDSAQRFKGRLEIDFWDNFTMDELIAAVRVLPAKTAILFGRMFRDTAGQALISSEVARTVAQEANAPVYVMTETTLGTGAVGGSLSSVEAFGKRAGELARLVLSGTDIKSLPLQISTESSPIFDWRALQRWHIPEGRLPPNSIIRFRPHSFWEEYQWYIIGAVIIMFLQTAMILDLLLQRRRRWQTEAELRENREIMELAASAGELGLWSRDLKTGDVWANKPMRFLFGFTAADPLRFEDLLGRVHPNDRERMLLHIEHAETAETQFQGEFRIVLPDHKERWVLAKGRTIVEPGDSVTRRMGVVLDITERKRAEEKFHSAIEASPNAILMVDDQGRIFLVNAQAERLFGYSREELLGQSVEMLVPERFRAEHPADRAAFNAAPQTRVMGVGRELFGLRKDGKEIPIEIGLSPVHAEEGLITLATIVDVSERKRNAEALETERSFLRQVIDTTPNFIFAKDREGRFTLANQAVADAYGTTVDDLIGKTDADFNSNNEEVDSFRRVDREVIDTLEEHFVAEEHITDSAGKVRWLQTVKRPIIGSDGHANQVLGASTDITRRKETEIELREQRSELAHVARISTMGELAASLAHELNQPLTAILSNAQAALRFLSHRPADLEEVREILEDIVKDNSRAGEVIRRMRALVKKEKLEFALLDLANVIREVVVLVHSDAILQNVKVTMDIEDHSPPVRGDKVQLQQVVLNLLLNAFDAMSGCPADEREVILRLAHDGTESIHVAVSDRGTGLSGDKLDKLFQPFFTTKGEGLGMGLSICRSIIEAHGGRLWAENNAIRGATFYFTLPVEGAQGQRGEDRGAREECRVSRENVERREK